MINVFVNFWVAVPQFFGLTVSIRPFTTTTSFDYSQSNLSLCDIIAGDDGCGSNDVKFATVWIELIPHGAYKTSLSKAYDFDTRVIGGVVIVRSFFRMELHHM